MVTEKCDCCEGKGILPDEAGDESGCFNCNGSGTLKFEEQPEDDYQKYRGKCREMSQALCDTDPDLELVRGHFLCSSWGEQPHWWCVRKSTGEIVDPSVRQFPSGRIGIVSKDRYVPYNGFITCEQCGIEVAEAEAYIYGNHTYCTSRCFGIDVGLV